MRTLAADVQATTSRSRRHRTTLHRLDGARSPVSGTTPYRRSGMENEEGAVVPGEPRTPAGHQLEFTASENPWAPTAVVAELNERTGIGLELIGLSEQEGGTSSAAYVRWPDGRQGALSRSTLPFERIRQSAGVLTAARDRGLPVPRHDLVLEVSDGMLAIVQERLPGRPLSRVRPESIEAMVAMNEAFAGLLADRPDIPAPPAFSPSRYSDGQWGGTLGQLGERGQRLLAGLRGPGDVYRMTGADLVHPDYGLGNILWDQQGRITGIVDWNGGAARGDRRFALLGLERNLAVEGDLYGAEPAGSTRLDELVTALIDPATLKTYRAHAAVEHAHRSIAEGLGPDRIARDLREAERQVLGE